MSPSHSPVLCVVWKEHCQINFCNLCIQHYANNRKYMQPTIFFTWKHGKFVLITTRFVNINKKEIHCLRYICLFAFTLYLFLLFCIYFMSFFFKAATASCSNHLMNYRNSLDQTKPLSTSIWSLEFRAANTYTGVVYILQVATTVYAYKCCTAVCLQTVNMFFKRYTQPLSLHSLCLPTFRLPAMVEWEAVPFAW